MVRHNGSARFELVERRGTPKTQRLAVVEPKSPFEDIEHSNEVDRRPEPTRESIKSFWIAIAGLAILAHIFAVALTISVSHYQYLVVGWFFRQQISFYDWRTAEMVRQLVTEYFVPSIVIASVIPILYWRGNLIQRFTISLLIAVTVLNLSGSEYWQINLQMLLPGLTAICLCWMSLPILFLITPIRTKRLRLFVATSIFILCFCVSLQHMNEAAENVHYLYWETFYSVAFCLALIRRNWGNVATLEATATSDQIETTSSRTLMEMMIVGSLACAAAMFWSVRPDTAVFLDLGSAVGLAIVSVWASTWTIRRRLENRSTMVSNLLIWFGVGCYFACSVVLVIHFQFARISISVAWLSDLVAIVTAFVMSGFYIFYLYLASRWLRWCGWSIANSKLISGPMDK